MLIRSRTLVPSIFMPLALAGALFLSGCGTPAAAPPAVPATPAAAPPPAPGAAAPAPAARSELGNEIRAAGDEMRRERMQGQGR